MVFASPRALAEASFIAALHQVKRPRRPHSRRNGSALGTSGRNHHAGLTKGSRSDDAAHDEHYRGKQAERGEQTAERFLLRWR